MNDDIPIEEAIQRFAEGVDGVVEVVLTPIAMSRLARWMGNDATRSDERGPYLVVETTRGSVRVRRDPA